MNRTILYYPEIQVPTAGEWIRKALLYWDQIAAIVPGSYHDYAAQLGRPRYPKELQKLLAAGIFRPVNPNALFRAGDPLGLEQDVDRFIKTRGARLAKYAIIDEPIYRDKASGHIFGKLSAAGLAKDPGEGPAYLLERVTACAYMAFLAKHMAIADSGMTVPGTDRESASDIAFGSDLSDGAAVGLSAELEEILPVPSANVPLDDILNFRAKHQAERLSFNAAQDAFQSSLAKAEDIRHATTLVTSHREGIVRECIELEKAMRASKIETTLGSLQAFIKPTSPAILGATVVLAGKATSLVSLPVEYIAAGASVAGAIEVSAHLFNKSEARRQTLKNSPFAYVFLAKKKFGETNRSKLQ